MNPTKKKGQVIKESKKKKKKDTLKKNILVGFVLQ